MKNKKLVKQWIEFSNNDYYTVGILSQAHKKPFEIICFHCQQAVEKRLKALLLAEGIEIEKTHDLIFLRPIAAESQPGR